MVSVNGSHDATQRSSQQSRAICAMIEKAIIAQIEDCPSIIVAYSGGVDSTVLLHALATIKAQRFPHLQLRAIHIHHGISQNADVWAEHCQKFCETWSVPLVIEKVKLDLTKGNIEEQARQARYFAIKKYTDQYTAALCTAQHLDDQSETFLLALKRGSGPTGLSAMPMRSTASGYLHLRPLLTISRQQIEEYAHHYQLTWVEDESNQDAHYDRNFLRLNIIPKLKQRWPHFDQMVARSAMLCQQQQTLLDELLQQMFNSLIYHDGSLLLMPLLDASDEKFNALIRMWLKKHNVLMPTMQQLYLLKQTVVLAREDSNPQFILHNKQIRRYQNRLYLLPCYQDLQGIILNWDMNQPLTLPDNLGDLTVDASDCVTKNCHLPTPTERVSVSFMAQGRFQVVGRQGSRPIKKLWQEYGIAPWARARIPLIYYNEALITAVGVFVTKQGEGQEVDFLVTEKK